MTAWVVRAGRIGEREAWAVENNVAGAGWHLVPDMTNAHTKDAVRAMVEAAFPTAPPGRLANFTGQLWAIRDTIKPDDLIVMPMKTTKKIALGVCTSGYHYRSQEADGDSRHTIGVDWKRTDVSRASIRDDLLNTINGAMTIFQATKNNAAARLHVVIDTGIDPGGTAVTITTKRGSARPTPTTVDDSSADVADPTPAPTREAIRDRVTTHLVEHFKGHRLTDLIAAILRVEGYVCEISPPGPDQGVDIIAGRGPLGLDPPTLIIEVKSEAGQIGSAVVRGLQGAMSAHRADQGLLVAWGEG